MVQTEPVKPRATELTDEMLVERVLAGEVLLFEVLMRRNNGRVYRTVRALIRDEEETEDVMQAAYLRAYANLSSFRGTARFSTWLAQIAYNEALGRLRSLRRHPALRLADLQDDLMPTSPNTPSPEASAEHRELAELLERAVDALPELYRTVFMLRQVEGLDTAETAQVLSVSEEVVKTRLSRARATLRDWLEKMVGAGAEEAFAFHAPRCDRVVSGVMQKLNPG